MTSAMDHLPRREMPICAKHFTKHDEPVPDAQPESFRDTCGCTGCPEPAVAIVWCREAPRA